MNELIKQKILKIYELAEKGVAGERDAAKLALDRLMKKHNLTEEALSSLKLRRYTFKYASELDLNLFVQLMYYFFGEEKYKIFKSTYGVKEISVKLEYLDFVQIETAYGYFKPHMNEQWRKTALPILKRYRNLKNKNNRRKELQKMFFEQYISKSGIYTQDQLKEADFSDKELNDYFLFNSEVEGGKYKKQVDRGLYIE
ncbi:hypothetical protein EDM00_09460 [Ornithobacterium rhinotracheale]|uniref:hypothetical protein n=1 Tax=Ornithobacterium rhinotracheale TaxID=28251 RepID=UPI00129C76A8|nr:hypothetical protein [Ornithobacterium rhinotracheale]MRI64214.1 hypothetical protein [Ornithobacterium rhinotracheale]